MTPPKVKKVKTSSGPAVVFTSPRVKPDVCFHVFNKEFHVHSLPLKANSVFFSTFLEPAGGKAPTSSSSFFTSEWFTKVDGDDDKAWALSSDSDFRDLPTLGFKGNVTLQESAFEKFLCAIFHRQHQITNAIEIRVITQMADYYGALQTISMSVFSSFYQNPNFKAELSKEPCILLETAYKLRHEKLFRESFIHVLGPWSKPRYLELTEPTLLKLCHSAHAKMTTKLWEVHLGILKFLGDSFHNKYEGAGHQTVDLASGCLNNDKEFIFPMYYRRLYEGIFKKALGGREVKADLESLLSNSLILDKNWAQSGEGEFKDFFLCFEVDTLPWDTTQTDW